MADPADKYRNYPGGPVTNVGHQPNYSGLNNAAEYTASGLPFSSGVIPPVTGTVGSLDFPFVTSEIYLKNNGGADMLIGWTENGVAGTNHYVLGGGETATFRIRTNIIYFSTVGGTDTLSVTAALTQIPGYYYPTLTGSLADPVTGLPLHVTGTLTPPNGYGYFGVG